MTNKPFQPEFYKVKRKPSQKQIEANRRNGRLGGLKKVPKGAALHTEEQQKEFSAKGVAARKLKKEQS